MVSDANCWCCGKPYNCWHCVVLLLLLLFMIELCDIKRTGTILQPCIPFCAVEGFGVPLWYLDTDLSLSSGLLLFLAVQSTEISLRLCAGKKQLNAGEGAPGPDTVDRFLLTCMSTLSCVSLRLCTESRVGACCRLRCRAFKICA